MHYLNTPLLLSICVYSVLYITFRFQDGYFKTGDIGEMDSENQNITLIDRFVQ